MRPPSSLKNFEDDESDPILRIGQAFCIGCNESLLINPSSNILAPTLFLCSTKKTERTSTKSTNRQMIYMSRNNDADSVWVVVKPSLGHSNASERYLTNGQPLTISDLIQITHRQVRVMYIISHFMIH